VPLPAKTRSAEIGQARLVGMASGYGSRPEFASHTKAAACHDERGVRC
jgi:hypothetical protein